MADSTEELRFRAVGEDVSAGRMLDKLARGADKAGTEVKDLNKDLARLDDQMGATEVKIKGLLREFAETGDKSLFRDIRKDRSQLNMLKSIRKELAGEGREAGKAVSTGIADALGALPSQLKGAGIAIGVVLAVAMAPAVGAASVLRSSAVSVPAVLPAVSRQPHRTHGSKPPASGWATACRAVSA